MQNNKSASAELPRMQEKQIHALCSLHRVIKLHVFKCCLNVKYYFSACLLETGFVSVLTAAGAQCHLTSLIGLKENIFCAVRKAFSYFWLQCGYSVTNVVVQ